MLSFRLSSFSFPGVSVEHSCVLVLAPSKNGKEPCCSHPYQSQGLCSPHQTALCLFQASSWNWSVGPSVWGDISLLSWAGQYSCFLLWRSTAMPATVPSLSLGSAPAPAFPTLHSLLIHLLMLMILRNFPLFLMVHPHYCCPGFFPLFPKAWHLEAV